VSIVVMLRRHRRRCVVMDVSEGSDVMGVVAILGAVLCAVLVACATISMVHVHTISMVHVHTISMVHVHVGIGMCMLAPAAALDADLGVYLGVYLGVHLG
jgi:hypothetical protein